MSIPGIIVPGSFSPIFFLLLFIYILVENLQDQDGFCLFSEGKIKFLFFFVSLSIWFIEEFLLMIEHKNMSSSIYGKRVCYCCCLFC